MRITGKPPQGVARGARLELTIEKGVYRGLGLARHEGRVVFVPHAFPGERVQASVAEVTNDFVRARLETVLRPAPSRRPSPCPYVPECGGCSYQELAYEEQLALKQAILHETLARSGVPWDQPIPLRASPETGWRTRARWHLARRGGDLVLGLRQEGSRRVIDVESCLQLAPEMNRAARGVLGGLRARPAQAARVHGLELVESLDGADRVAALETALLPEQAAGLSSLGDSSPWLSGFGVVAKADGPFARFVPLQGSPFVHFAVAGYRLRAHIGSFFQANRFLVHELVEAVLRRTPAGADVLDLYAGVGLFALPLAARAERVRAAEINPLAADDARHNARVAGLGQVRILTGDVREALATWPVDERESVVLDPPRSGAGAEVVRAVAERRPASVVYVSCDPPTLGRDLRLFGSLGLRLESLEAFDLFPDTFHLETVAQLVPA